MKMPAGSVFSLNKAACRGWPGELKGMARIRLARSTYQEYTNSENLVIKKRESKHLISRH